MRCLPRKGTAPSLQNPSQLCCSSVVQVLGCDTHHTAPSLPVRVFSIHLACYPQFFSDSSQITSITLSQPLQLPPNEFIATVRSLIAFNNISYVQILFTDPTDAWNVRSSSCFMVILATLYWGMKGKRETWLKKIQYCGVNKTLCILNAPLLQVSKSSDWQDLIQRTPFHSLLSIWRGAGGKAKQINLHISKPLCSRKSLYFQP